MLLWINPSCALVIPLGFEPKTYCLEGSCSNPTELRNPFKAVQNYFILSLSPNNLDKTLNFEVKLNRFWIIYEFIDNRNSSLFWVFSMRE